MNINQCLCLIKRDKQANKFQQVASPSLSALDQEKYSNSDYNLLPTDLVPILMCCAPYAAVELTVVSATNQLKTKTSIILELNNTVPLHATLNYKHKVKYLKYVIYDRVSSFPNSG